MSKRGKRYTKEFRYQMVQLVRAGREIPELSKEFGVSVWSIRNWVKQAARDAGTGDQGLTSSTANANVTILLCSTSTKLASLRTLFGFFLRYA